MLLSRGFQRAKLGQLPPLVLDHQMYWVLASGHHGHRRGTIVLELVDNRDAGLLSTIWAQRNLLLLLLGIVERAHCSTAELQLIWGQIYGHLLAVRVPIVAGGSIWSELKLAEELAQNGSLMAAKWGWQNRGQDGRSLLAQSSQSGGVLLREVWCATDLVICVGSAKLGRQIERRAREINWR